MFNISENKPPIKRTEDTEQTSYAADKSEHARDAPATSASFQDVMDKKKGAKKKQQEEEEVAAQSNTSIFQMLGKTDNLDSEVDDKKGGGAKGLMDLASTKTRNEFQREQPDLSSVNPNFGSIVSELGSVVAETATRGDTTATQLQQTIDQILAKLYVLETNGKTDTILTLKNPPIFNGADIVISSFKTANGEFNIAFHNLTQEAKALIDQNQAILRHSLEEKGYLVHIIVVTTKPIEAVPQAEASQQAEKERQGKQQQDQDQKKDK